MTENRHCCNYEEEIHTSRGCRL